MGLENTFGKVEKLPEEKKLEVISSKDSVVDDLRAYFEKDKYSRKLGVFDKIVKYFSSCMDFLKTFELTPEIITEFNTKAKDITGKKYFNSYENEVFGTYLSAMIQTSYNQGFNNFTFEEVNADSFGTYLKGKPENPIRITVKELKGYDILWYAENCSLTAETIKGKLSLRRAENCLAEITNYQGEDFGFIMKNCTIKSENKETLETIKEQVDGGRNNKFELTKWV